MVLFLSWLAKLMKGYRDLLFLVNYRKFVTPICYTNFLTNEKIQFLPIEKNHLKKVVCGFYTARGALIKEIVGSSHEYQAGEGKLASKIARLGKNPSLTVFCIFEHMKRPLAL